MKKENSAVLPRENRLEQCINTTSDIGKLYALGLGDGTINW